MTLVMWNDARHVSRDYLAFNPVKKSFHAVQRTHPGMTAASQEVWVGHWNRKVERPIIFVKKAPC
jgi:hypothetical protein